MSVHTPTAFESRAAVAARDLHVAFGGAPVLIGVRWEVPTGAIAAVMGLSGAGKSTLLAALAGAVPRSAGRCEILGADPARAETRRLIGFMPQLGGLYPDLSAEDNLRIFAAGMGVKAAADDLVEKTLELVGVRSRRREILKTLSAGYQKRVSLGAALVAQPAVLLLDEPFAYADAPFAERVWAHLRELAGKGRTIVLATADAAQAARADRLLVLRAGRPAFDGPLAELVPPGKARVTLSYREKTGPLHRTVEVQDYRTELPALVSGQMAKPYAVEIEPESLERQLRRLLSEETHAELRP
jgi:ABC-type multidrug transport system ATPase subunit